MGRPLLKSEHLRTKTYCYFKPLEKETITEKANLAGLSLSTFIRETALGKKITALPTGNIQHWQSLGRTTANLNQIAKQLNEGKLVNIDPLLLLVVELKEQVQALRLDLLDNPNDKQGH
jgi:hypothetical protein